MCKAGIHYRQQLIKALIRLYGWLGWSKPFLFTYNKHRFPTDHLGIIHFNIIHQFVNKYKRSHIVGHGEYIIGQSALKVYWEKWRITLSLGRTKIFSKTGYFRLAKTCLTESYHINTARRNEPRHEISNNVVCVTSKASDQTAHIIASHLNILWLLSYWLNIIWNF